MMKFHVKAPVGYHLSISSNDDFVLYNESAAYDSMHKVNRRLYYDGES